MPVRVKHLNADSSFLLSLSPEEQASNIAPYLHSEPYTILIDPWITGVSIVSKPWFAISKRNAPACITHLTEIPEPDLVIVSQNKPDHCHKETLLQLRPEGKTTIVAEPAAAKAIKSWNHFDPARVFGLPKYNPRDRFSLLRFHVPPLSPGGHPGEVTVAFIPAKVYVTGLHNAIGITYRPPTAAPQTAVPQTIQSPRRANFVPLPLSPASLPPRSPSLSPPSSERPSADGLYPAGIDGYRPRISRLFHARSIELMYSTPSARLPPSPPLSPPMDKPKRSSDDMAISPPTLLQSSMITTPPSSPGFPSPNSIPSSSSSSPLSHPHSQVQTPSPPPTSLPRPTSILYSPHGIRFRPDLQPYIQTHLLKLGALPLSLLLHSFNHLQNPWYLGGTVVFGCEGGGAEIARGLMAKAWVSAHDEEKDDRGLAVWKTVTKRLGVEEVRRILGAEEEGELSTRKGWRCEVRSLGAGEEMVIDAS